MFTFIVLLYCFICACVEVRQPAGVNSLLPCGSLRWELRSSGMAAPLLTEPNHCYTEFPPVISSGSLMFNSYIEKTNYLNYSNIVPYIFFYSCNFVFYSPRSLQVALEQNKRIALGTVLKIYFLIICTCPPFSQRKRMLPSQ